jgi:stage V sporulation protein R
VELDLDYAHATLANIQHIWTRPVHVATVRDDEPILLSFDGKEHSESEFEELI